MNSLQTQINKTVYTYSGFPPCTKTWRKFHKYCTIFKVHAYLQLNFNSNRRKKSFLSHKTSAKNVYRKTEYCLSLWYVSNDKSDAFWARNGGKHSALFEVPIQRRWVWRTFDFLINFLRIVLPFKDILPPMFLNFLTFSQVYHSLFLKNNPPLEFFWIWSFNFCRLNLREFYL